MRLRRRDGTAAVGTVPVPRRSGHEDQPLFVLERVAVDKGGRRILDVDHAAIPRTGATAIVGPSGSGKSTLLRLCNRLDVPSSGIVRFHGEDLAGMDPRALRREVAMVFQQPVALPGTVAENLRAGRPDLSEDDAVRALERVGLSAELVDRPADQLSGGERQRLALARSLATDPSVVLLDEATSALDPASAARVEELVGSLAADGIHAVWVSHDLDALERIADHVLVVIGGRIAQQGPLEAVRGAPEPAVARFFDGEAA